MCIRDRYRDERRDPEKATHAACLYLKDLYKQFDNWYLALAAYNCGSGRVSRASKIHQTYDFWQMHSLPRETRNYVPYFLSAAIIARNPEAYDFKVPTNVKPFEYETINLEKSADISVLARVAGLKPKVLREYNPELRQSATPTEAGYPLKLPMGTKEHFLTAWNAIPEEERFAPQFVVHRVRFGESLWTISKKYNVSIHDLAAVNKIRNRNKVRVGQKLNVPLKGGNSWVNANKGGPRGYSKRIYKVKRGDTLGQIAENFGTFFIFGLSPAASVLIILNCFEFLVFKELVSLDKLINFDDETLVNLSLGKNSKDFEDKIILGKLIEFKNKY